MLVIKEVDYNHLLDFYMEDFFSLRKKTFSDRLGWSVKCEDGMEFDEYDNDNAKYLLGFYEGEIICGVRLIDFNYDNLITGVFKSFFENVIFPEGKFTESSRIFIDKDRVKYLGSMRKTVIYQLFLAMINYSLMHNYEGILTIVSLPMLKIIRRSGWLLEIVQKGLSEKNESIYLIKLFNDVDSINSLKKELIKLGGSYNV
ncbi:acyl-homoserine-lactone synthase [Erwinia aphidicola]|uniref:acyl-homoserine-lactone synthase n=1 Tax=Erwinia aphidicola TaxID=68334 RepID=UPI00300C9862